MVVHIVLLLVLALMSQEQPPKDVERAIVVSDQEATEELDELEEEKVEVVDEQVLQSEAAVIQDNMVVEADPVDTPFSDPDAAALAMDPVDFSDQALPFDPLATAKDGLAGAKGVAGRGMAARAKLVASGGGTDASERAVRMGLKWIAKHQMPDGGWSFDHRLSPQCRGQCSAQGEMPEARIGATAMALLPFLGAGQTHKEGEYKKQVEAGLAFLARSMKVSNRMGSLHEKGGSMYSHGLASIALCEAYAMTQDKQLLGPAQLSINFIVYAQDPAGGGWRYQPRTAGDTSVVGWQVMALKSAHMAYLEVPGQTVKKSMQFLDFVQSDGGAKYGYVTPGAKPSTTAIGLLCRMHLGWKKDNPALIKGLEYLSKEGPHKTDMYYNYYAAQVFRHIGGPMWDKWNNVMREQLVSTQAKKGHEEGSWYFQGAPHGDKGGRLYATALATMTLEVYYRHLPIYSDSSTEQDFPDL